ncbi:hypothetical protein NEUTE1DRAFT_106136 [Neurospora tetrasperma FGSC 2508]|uniref:Uncharacterized protein n=1 Tax=Neurospora tetrasperma (strain FGSC 2508 / ATCC MYA-4615 / P0657) TaxID=510951 RepID=F8N1S6_NEUT8|nr:uncharacterized protein NEUTE1DRAFT_106136 [Neurospora tetrasperma FGSC 2508]EGO53202.1 hypothetical protein NEUTE1DRAFT_106136 [Neurospora tetrasperma FGSC 2508]
MRFPSAKGNSDCKHSIDFILLKKHKAMPLKVLSSWLWTLTQVDTTLARNGGLETKFRRHALAKTH